MKDRGTVTDWICFHQEIWNEFDNRETFNLYFVWRDEFYNFPNCLKVLMHFVNYWLEFKRTVASVHYVIPRNVITSQFRHQPDVISRSLNSRNLICIGNLFQFRIYVSSLGDCVTLSSMFVNLRCQMDSESLEM
jgi:hypothetical protein